MVALIGALEDLAAGQAGVVVVEGPAGIGKSPLLAELRPLAADRGCRVLTARGSQPERKAYVRRGVAVLHGLFWLTVSLSEGAPLVLALDDLQ